jgi:hypothetical protein
VYRRQLLRSIPLFVASGCLADPPGRTGPRNPPAEPATRPGEDRSPLRVATFDIAERDDGQLRVSGRVRNDGTIERQATVRAAATVDGERTVAETTVTVAAGGSEPFSIGLGVSYEAFAGGGSLDVGVVQ